MKVIITLLTLSLLLSACSKSDQVDKKQAQIQMQADKARLDLQEKADALARHPPPELIRAAREQAAAAAKTGHKE